MKDNRSFFEKLTGGVRLDEEDTEKIDSKNSSRNSASQTLGEYTDEEPEEGQLTVDVYQTPTEIIIKTMVAGVRPEDLDVAITRDMVTIKGKRETERNISEENYFHQELYWGSFSRTVMLPAEIEVEECDAIEKHGLLIITCPKIDRHKQARLKVKG